jgi:hypothetical protein
MKFIKRRHEGELHNTHFIMWQKSDYGYFRLFINIFRYQIVLDWFPEYKDIRIRKMPIDMTLGQYADLIKQKKQSVAPTDTFYSKSIPSLLNKPIKELDRLTFNEYEDMRYKGYIKPVQENIDQMHNAIVENSLNKNKIGIIIPPGDIFTNVDPDSPKLTLTSLKEAEKTIKNSSPEKGEPFKKHGKQ